MNINIDKLRKLTHNLEFVGRQHGDILAIEPLIQGLLDKAVNAAR